MSELQGKYIGRDRAYNHYYTPIVWLLRLLFVVVVVVVAAAAVVVIVVLVAAVNCFPSIFIKNHPLSFPLAPPRPLD